MVHAGKIQYVYESQIMYTLIIHIASEGHSDKPGHSGYAFIVRQRAMAKQVKTEGGHSQAQNGNTGSWFVSQVGVGVGAELSVRGLFACRLVRLGARSRALLLALEAEPVVCRGMHRDLLEQEHREEAAARDARHDLPHGGHRRCKRDPDLRPERLLELRDDGDRRVCDLNALRESCGKRGRELALELVLEDCGRDGYAPRLMCPLSSVCICSVRCNN